MKTNSQKSQISKLVIWLMAMMLCTPVIVSAQDNSQPVDPDKAQAEDGDDAESEDGDDEEDMLEEVIVVADGYRESLRSAIMTKQNAKQIVDAITAEEMGRFPANNLAEAMQGIPGVSMTRNDGLGEFISVRGMAPELTRIEMNGRSVSLTAGSNNPENATTLSFFSPDMFSRVTVIKTPRAIDIEGGVGGTIKLETLRPLDVGEFKARFSGSYGESTVKQDPTYNFGGFFNTIFADGRMGLTLGVSYTDADRRTDQFESLDGWSPVDEDDPSLGVYPERVRQQQRVGEQPRINVSGTLELDASDNLNLWVDMLYAQEDRNELQQRLEVEYDRGRFDSGTVDSNGNMVIGNFTRTRATLNFLDRERDIEQYGYTFGGEWGNDLWIIIGKASFSESNESTAEARARARNRRIDAGYDATNPDFLAITDFAGGTDLTDWVTGVGGFPDYDRLDWNIREIGTEETAFQFDFERELGGVFSTLFFGVRDSSRDVNRRQGQVRTNQIDGFEDPAWFDSLAENNFYFNNAADPMIGNWVRPDTASMRRYFNQVLGLVEYDESNTWNITEDTLAGYVMVDFDNDTGRVPFSGNVGVRYVDYAYSGRGFQTDPQDTGSFIPYRPKANDTTWLPSANMNFNIAGPDSGNIIRLAFGRVLSRPNPQFIKPTAELSDDLDSVEVGNPTLEPYLAWQYDIAYEKYFGETGEGLFAFGVFYKDVENFFEEVTLENQDLSPWGVPDTGTITTFLNGGSAKVKGVEVSFQTPFLFLSGIGQNFGVVANYTYVDSERTTDDGSKAPMPGTSEHSANVILYFSNERVDTRLIFNYRDDYLLNEDDQEYVEGSGRLDFAFRFNLTEALVASLDVRNLTEETEYGYYDGIKSRFHKRQLEGRSWLLGLSYSF